MTNPLDAGGVPINFAAPNTVNSPMDGFVLDPLTGCMSFNEGTVGNYVIAVMVLSYDNAGNLISSVTTDFQIEVIACANTPPNLPPTGGITNFNGAGGNGGGTQTGSNSVSLCYGDVVCFDVVFDDDKSDQLNKLDNLLKHQDFMLKLLTKKDSFVRKKLLDNPEEF